MLRCTLAADASAGIGFFACLHIRVLISAVVPAS
jgi:hypothetical protein